VIIGHPSFAQTDVPNTGKNTVPLPSLSLRNFLLIHVIDDEAILLSH